MAKKSNHVKQDYTISKKKKANGETIVTAHYADGTSKHLLNPAQKGRKYAKELSGKKDVYSGEKLKNTQMAYRSGYLKARSDAAKAYKASQKKK